MKSNQKSLFSLFSVLFLAALAALTSCRKDPEEIAALISSSEAAEIVEDAVASRTSGLTAPTVDAAALVEAYLNTCGTPGDTTIQKSNNGPVASSSYTFNMDWLVTCSDLGIPQSANVGIQGAGNYTSAHWKGSDNTTGDLVFTGLSPQESAYVVNGSYDLTGNITGNLRKVDPSINCTVTLDLVNLTLDKTTYKITGGNGTVVVNASTANGQNKTLNGAIVFNGNGSATVNINGYEHTFQWQ